MIENSHVFCLQKKKNIICSTCLEFSDFLHTHKNKNKKCVYMSGCVWPEERERGFGGEKKRVGGRIFHFYSLYDETF